jgi:hypothetical protein
MFEYMGAIRPEPFCGKCRRGSRCDTLGCPANIYEWDFMLWERELDVHL